MGDDSIPQWKKELIARLRSQNRRCAQREQLFSPPPARPVQQPAVAVGSREKCNVSESPADMVQKESDSGESGASEEDLHYGPGIVNKLRKKYLSLAQRENSKVRATILPMRKAASLENIIDEEDPPAKRLFQPVINGTKEVPRRYRENGELKRAKSEETISVPRSPEPDDTKPKRESLHEEMLITMKEGNDDKPPIDKKIMEITIENKHVIPRNRPKRITPLLDENEKPPADFVRQAKLIFERRPEQRTRAPPKTGEVAEKVEKYKKLQIKSKKPMLKTKPTVLSEKKTNSPRKTSRTPPTSPISPLLSPIPDVSRVEFAPEENGTASLSETPDLIVTSSPVHVAKPPSARITEDFIEEERRQQEALHDTGYKKVITPIKSAASTLYDFSKTPIPPCHSFSHLPPQNKSSGARTKPQEPPKLEVNGVIGNVAEKSPSPTDNEPRGPSPKPPTLTTVEIENLKNAAKSSEQPSVIVVKRTEEVTVSRVVGNVPKVKTTTPPREPETNSIVFKFPKSKDVPDYVRNDGVNRVVKPERPKVGDGGIIVLPGASIGESFTDEDDELFESLKRPPSPCDVFFINDNILIGKSSIRQKLTQRVKLEISFKEEAPEIYEYPSESSFLVEDDLPSSPPAIPLRPTVPSITGSSTLANYTPKSTENFLPGVTRSLQTSQTKQVEVEEPDSIEIEQPILFSAGTNSDMLF